MYHKQNTIYSLYSVHDGILKNVNLKRIENIINRIIPDDSVNVDICINMEGIVNALIHRSYTELGSEVHIDMFDDRLEIYSPGGMVGCVSIKDVDILNVPSKRRNPILADIFGRLKYMERRGSGFKKIINAYETQQNYRKELAPVFKAFNNDFILTLYNMNYGVDAPRESEPQRNPKETPKKLQLLIS